jgi:putative hydrolase of the HAD superfamily
MKHVLRAVIFDLYGTLVDLQVNEDSPLFWNTLASDFFGTDGYVSGEVLRDAFTSRVQIASKTIGEGFILNNVFTGMLEEFGVTPTVDNIRMFAVKFRELSITRLSKKSYTDGLLCAIRNSGYKLGLVSNTEALLTAYDLQVLSLEDKFEAIVLSSSVGVKKPDKRIFEIVLDRLAVKPKECTFVGDTFEDDIAGALNAGIGAVFLTAFTSIWPECEDEHEDRIVCAGFDLEEITGALRRFGFAIPSLAG